MIDGVRKQKRSFLEQKLGLSQMDLQTLQPLGLLQVSERLNNPMDTFDWRQSLIANLDWSIKIRG